MPPIQIDNAYQFTITMRTTGGSFVGQFGFGASILTGPTTAEFATFTTAVINAITSNNVDDAISSTLKFDTLRMHSYDQPTLADLVSTLNVAGVETGDPLPYNVAAIVSFRTSLAGSGNRGRCYVPGYTEASSVANTLNSTSKTNLTAMFNSIDTALGTAFGDGELAVVSRANLTVTDVVSISAESTFATQQRRLRRVRTG